MQKEIYKKITQYNFDLMLRLAIHGDKVALTYILNILEPEMIKVSSFIKMPREDILQELRLRFIEEIRKDHVNFIL